MEKYILALNCGSSSLKFTLFLIKEKNKLHSIIEGTVEEIGNLECSRIKMNVNEEKHIYNIELPTHQEALLSVFEKFNDYSITKDSIKAVGHRVVHGGTIYNSSVLIDANVINTIEELFPIAPLHNPPNLEGIKVAIELLPNIPQVAVFDTAFHSSIPEYAFRYAIPDLWYKEFNVRTYGFHGTSHMYVSKRAAKFLNIPYNKLNCITAHLGNGCSLSKIENGKSIDTSMGFTPLEGVIMGTRSGDIDPMVVNHVVENIIKKENLNHENAYKKVFNALNKECGLKALSGTNMMQDIRSKAEDGDIQSELIVSIYAYRIAKYIGSYWSTLPTCEALIFTAGLGENEGYVRKKILEFLKNIKIELNEENNKIRKTEIEIGKSTINNLSVLVIPTDEESVIGYDTFYLGYLNEKSPKIYPFEID